MDETHSSAPTLSSASNSATQQTTLLVETLLATFRQTIQEEMVQSQFLLTPGSSESPSVAPGAVLSTSGSEYI